MLAQSNPSVSVYVIVSITLIIAISTISEASIGTHGRVLFRGRWDAEKPKL